MVVPFGWWSRKKLWKVPSGNGDRSISVGLSAKGYRHLSQLPLYVIVEIRSLHFSGVFLHSNIRLSVQCRFHLSTFCVFLI